MTSIFTPLLRYRAEGKTRKEDFLTDVLCGVFNRRRGLAADYAEWLMKENKDWQEGNQLDEDSIIITPQKQVRGVRPDIWIEARDQSGNRHVLIVENKLEAQEGDNQLPSYLEVLEGEEARTKTLAYVTHASADPPNIDEVVHLRWFEVHRWLKDWTKENEGEELVSELVKLLEDWNLDTTLSTTDLTKAFVWKNSTQYQLVQILEIIKVEVYDSVDLVKGDWYHGRRRSKYTYFISPNFEGFEDVKLEFGFDFKRNNDEWNVGNPEVPSAYMTICDKGNQLPRPKEWSHASKELDWTEYRWAKQISKPVCLNRSLVWANVYRKFFEDALSEVKACLASVNTGSDIK